MALQPESAVLKIMGKYELVSPSCNMSIGPADHAQPHWLVTTWPRKTIAFALMTAADYRIPIIVKQDKDIEDSQGLPLVNAQCHAIATLMQHRSLSAWYLL